jgi:hypothetical protein
MRSNEGRRVQKLPDTVNLKMMKIDFPRDAIIFDITQSQISF